MISTLAVVNPASAGGRTGRRWPELRRLLLGVGIEVEEHLTTGPGDATAAVRRHLGSGVERVIAVGGDGTLNEVANGFFDERCRPLPTAAALGLLPSGTGGDFRRSVGVPAGARDAVSVLAGGASWAVDAGLIEFGDGNCRAFLNIADCGVGGEVVARVNRSRFKQGGPLGSAVFLWQSLATLLRFPGAAATVRVDGARLSGRLQSVVVANGRYFGGGMKVAPEARLDDGLLDVVVVEQRRVADSLAGLPSLYRGRHLRRAGVSWRRGRSVVIESEQTPLLFDVEGEQVGATPARITCLPGAIRLLVPRHIAAAGSGSC